MLTKMLATVTARNPNAPALYYGDRCIGFGDLLEASDRLASGLAELGVGPGDRVAFWLPNVPAYLELYFACARLGAIAVAVNTRYRSSEVGDIIGRSGAKLLIMWPAFRGIPFLDILGDVDPAALERLETVVLYGESGETETGALPVGDRRCLNVAELARFSRHRGDEGGRDIGSNIFTTSGTTKAPKFVLHTHGSIVDHGQAVAADFGYDAPDAVMLQAMPFCGVFGFSQAMATIAAGRPMVLMPAFEAETALHLIERHRVTDTNGSDEMFARLMDVAAGGEGLASIRACGYAAFNAALADIVAEADRVGLTLCGLYGMSEVQALYARQPPEATADKRSRPGGRLVSPRAEVRVRDPETGALLAPGESGELEFKGPSLMAEYYGNPQATAEAFTEDGFLRSGDLGYLIPDGFVFQTRMGDVLRLGGFLTSPAEIEAHILEFPGIGDCQVVGAPTNHGERAVAFVTVEEGREFDEAAVITHCRSGLAGYKAPLRIISLEAFPTTLSANGVKIQRAKLREMASAAVRTEI